jgi:hypothetical protein
MIYIIKECSNEPTYDPSEPGTEEHFDSQRLLPRFYPELPK